MTNPPSVTSPRRLMRPDEYYVTLAADMSELDIHHLIVRSMAYALYHKSPGFRVAVLLSAVEQAKAMLKEAGWDTQVVHMGDVVAQIVVERPTPVVPLDVFLLGDVVVVAEDAKAARRVVILTAEATPITPMGSAFASGLLAAGDARQVDSSEVLSVYMWDEDGGTSVTHTAAEWVSSGWRGVIGPLDGSDLEARIRAALTHRPECDGVPCYCGEGGDEIDHGLPGTVVHADIEETLGILKDIVTQSSDGAERWAKLHRGGSTGDRTGLPDAARLVAQIGLERCGLELSWAAAMRTVDSMRHQRDAIHADLAHLTNMIGDTAKDLGVLCEGRTAMDFFPEVLAKTKADARLHSASLVNEAYRQRNAMVCVAAQLASDAGLHAGILVDEAGEPGFRTVVAIDLGHPPDGANQITFHMDERDPTKPWSGLPPYGGEWDGHSDIVKWARIASYLDIDHRATGISASDLQRRQAQHQGGQPGRVDLARADHVGDGETRVERAALGAHRGRVMFAQNADGLMDCSVWAIQSECEETVISDGGVCMTHRQVWKPVPFGPKTQRQHQMWELFLRGVSDVLRSPLFTQQISTLFRRDFGCRVDDKRIPDTSPRAATSAAIDLVRAEVSPEENLESLLSAIAAICTKAPGAA